MEEMIYLAADGNWGDARELLILDAQRMPQELYDEMVDDPEATFDKVREWFVKDLLDNSGEF